jgi:hypothetical protein
MTVGCINQAASKAITMGNVRRENLNAEEFASLKQVGNGLSQDNIPNEHKKRLIELRLVKQDLGNLRLTPHGIFLTHPETDPHAGMPRGRRER